MRKKPYRKVGHGSVEWEWVFAGLACLIVVVLFAYLLGHFTGH